MTDPQQYQTQYPQPPAAPTPPPKRSWFARHKILTGLGALITVVVVVNLASGGSKDDGATVTGAVPAAAAGKPAEAPAGFGVPVRDGKFEFVVQSVEPGVPSIGSNYLREEAQGQFVLVKMTVRNTGDREQSFTTSAQKLLDAQGRQYSVDSMATITLDQGLAFEQINPGNSVEATIVFDIPIGVVPVEITLHDSMFSGGSSVSLK